MGVTCPSALVVQPTLNKSAFQSRTARKRHPFGLHDFTLRDRPFSLPMREAALPSFLRLMCAGRFFILKAAIATDGMMLIIVPTVSGLKAWDAASCLKDNPGRADRVQARYQWEYVYGTGKRGRWGRE